MPQLLYARPRVYVVEDSRILCNVLCEALGAAGAEVVGSCDTADAAVRDIEALHPDAVMIDIALRRGTGFDVLKALNRLESTAVRVVLTNYTSETFRDAAARLGARIYDKAFDIRAAIDDIMATVDVLRQQHSAPRAA